MAKDPTPKRENFALRGGSAVLHLSRVSPQTMSFAHHYSSVGTADLTQNGRRTLSLKTSLVAILKGSLIAVLAISNVFGGTIYWGSEGFIDYKNSRNEAWTPAYTMELGVFKAGFTPTIENRGLWVENWVELGVAQYFSEEFRFAGVVDDQLPLPSGSGTQAYVWARNGDDLTKGPEWILMTNPAWQWPTVSQSNSPALTWTTGAVASPLVGTFAQPVRHLNAASVRPVAVPIADWLITAFPTQPEHRTSEGDPDGDGMSNQLEYFLGSDPTSGSSVILPNMAVTGGGTMLSLARNPYAETSFTLLQTHSLSAWTQLTLAPMIDRPDFIQIWVPATPGAKSSFFRFGLSPAIP